jgi:hypothetical protein
MIVDEVGSRLSALDRWRTIGPETGVLSTASVEMVT